MSVKTDFYFSYVERVVLVLVSISVCKHFRHCRCFRHFIYRVYSALS